MPQRRRESPSTVPAVYAARPPGDSSPQAACPIFSSFHLLGPVVDFRNYWRGQAPSENPPASAATGTGDVSVSTAQAACRAFDSGSCDRRHKLPFEYPNIFWTPREL